MRRSVAAGAARLEVFQHVLPAIGQWQRGASEVAAHGLETVTREAEGGVAALHAAVEAVAPPSTDTLPDAYTDLSRAVRGDPSAEGLAGLNDRLKASFETFRLDRLDDETRRHPAGPAAMPRDRRRRSRVSPRLD